MKLDQSASLSSSLMSTSTSNKNRLLNTMARTNENKTNVLELRSAPRVSSGIPVISANLCKTTTMKNNSKNLSINKRQSTNITRKRTLPSLELAKSTLSSSSSSSTPLPLPNSPCKTKLRFDSIERNLDAKINYSNLSLRKKISTSSASSSIALKSSFQSKKPITTSNGNGKMSSQLKVTSRTNQKTSTILPSSNSSGKNQKAKNVSEKTSNHKELLNVDYFVDSMIKCNILL